jgi:hypothetical protein
MSFVADFVPVWARGFHRSARGVLSNPLVVFGLQDFPMAGTPLDIERSGSGAQHRVATTKHHVPPDRDVLDDLLHLRRSGCLPSGPDAGLIGDLHRFSFFLLHPVPERRPEMKNASAWLAFSHGKRGRIT